MKRAIVISAMVIVFSFAGVASAAPIFSVSVNNVADSNIHGITVSPGDFFSVDLNMSTNQGLLDLLVYLRASVSDVFDITGGFYHSPWDVRTIPIPLGDVDPLSGVLIGSPGLNNTVGPGSWTFATLELVVDPNTSPGIYTLNVTSVSSSVCIMCPAFHVGNPGPDFVVWVVIEAAIDIDPNTLNLANKGKWVTCYIWLPEGYDVADIEPNSVRLEDVIAADWLWFDEEEQVAMAKFRRSDVQSILEPGNVVLAVSGELADGTRFRGIDAIRVIDKGRSLVNSNSIVKDGIEYYMETDKSVYRLGESVDMLYRVTNLSDKIVTFHFDDQVQHYFTVKDDGNLIWDAPKMGEPAGSSFVLLPNGYKEYSENWDMLDNQGVLITPGSYELTGSLHPVLLVPEDKDKYVPVSVEIKIIPGKKKR